VLCNLWGCILPRRSGGVVSKGNQWNDKCWYFTVKIWCGPNDVIRRVLVRKQRHYWIDEGRIVYPVGVKCLEVVFEGLAVTSGLIGEVWWSFWFAFPMVAMKVVPCIICCTLVICNDSAWPYKFLFLLLNYLYLSLLRPKRMCPWSGISGFA